MKKCVKYYMVDDFMGYEIDIKKRDEFSRTVEPIGVRVFPEYTRASYKTESGMVVRIYSVWAHKCTVPSCISKDSMIEFEKELQRKRMGEYE